MPMDGAVGTQDFSVDYEEAIRLQGLPTLSDEEVYQGQSLQLDRQNYFEIENVALGAGDWRVEFWVKIPSFVANGYALPLIQLGRNAEGADGFGLSLFSNHSGIKQVYLRHAYSSLVGADFPTEENSVAHITIVYQNGVAQVGVNGESWSSPITLPADFSQPKVLRVGVHNGAWLQGRTFFMDELRVSRELPQ